MANENRYYKTPFAESGNKSEVPDASVDGAVGYDSGFGPDYELPQGSTNRKRIERDLYNGMHYGITKNLKQWQENLYPTWIEDDGDGATYSYVEGMIVSHNNIDYISLEGANEEEPGTGIKWEEYNAVKSQGCAPIKTLSKAVGATSATAGDYVRISDRGNGLFQYLTGQSPDTYSIVACTGVPSLSLVLSKTQDLLTPYMFGLVDGTDASDQLEAFNTFVSDSLIPNVHYIGDCTISRKLILGSETTSNQINRSITFNLKVVTTHTNLTEEAVRIQGWGFVKAIGNLWVECGSIDYNSRRQLDGVLVANASRARIPDIVCGGAKRDAVRIFNDTTNNLSNYGAFRVFDSGLRDTATASNFVDSGSSGSVTQTTTFDLDEYTDDIEVGDYIFIGGQPHYVRATGGGNVTVYPWVVSPAATEVATVVAGSGVSVNGGNSSLINIDNIDGIRVGALYRSNALYNANVRVLHGSDVGIGLAIGRDRGAAIGGTIENFYLEGPDSQYDAQIVESSPAISGFVINGTNEFVTGDKHFVLHPSTVSRYQNAASVIKIHSLGAERLEIKDSGTRPDNDSGSILVPMFDVQASAISTYRDTQTIQLDYKEEVNRLTGLDTIRVLLAGTGVNGEPTGIITILPPAGWTVNGAASLSLTGLLEMTDLVCKYIVADNNIIVATNTLTLVP